MSRNEYIEREPGGGRKEMRHPLLANIIVIALVAVLGVVIVYVSLAIFTKHGEEAVVPGVEKMSYTDAIARLHEAGFRIEIRDSVYSTGVRPGYVIEQFPRAKSLVKPGRKIFLYIQAVHPKEVVIDDDNNPRLDALRGVSLRMAEARLLELGFKKENIRTVRLLGTYEGVAKIVVNGRVVKKMQRMPVNSKITIQVFDGRLRELSDSLMNIEFGSRRAAEEMIMEDPGSYSSSAEYSSEPVIPEAVSTESPTEVAPPPAEESNPYLE